MAESVTTSSKWVTAKVQEIQWSWTAASDGSLTSTAHPESVDGYVVGAVTNPGATAPQDNYDITVTDGDGCDVFGAALNNRDTANSEYAIPKADGTNYAERWVSGILTMNLSGNNVDSATGVLKVYIRRP